MALAPSCVEYDYDYLDGNITPGGNNIPTADGTIINEGAVDLGLSVQWAACNLGANTPWDEGDKFEWGNQSDYAPENICGTSYDQATQRLGEPWRLPTKEEAQELLSKCRWHLTEYRGVNGYTVTGPSGNAIFFPTEYSYIYLWTGTLDISSNKAYVLHASSYPPYKPEISIESRGIRRNIRPVCD